MTYLNLETEIKGAVASVWLNRPQVHNAFNHLLIAELTAELQALDANQAIRVIVLGGRGKSFCAGADLEWMKKAAGYTMEENLRDARLLAGMLQVLDRMRKPTVARVHGAALGGAVGLVAACDIAVASVNASFGTTEVRVGLIPATIAPYVAAAIGRRAARRYFLTGERITAADAAQIGLIHEVCEEATLDDRIGEVVERLLSGGPEAQAAAKHLLRTLASGPIDDWTAEYTAKTLAELRVKSEAREGLAAFLEKRKPSWHAENRIGV